MIGMRSLALPAAAVLLVWIGLSPTPALAQVDALIGVPVTDVHVLVAGRPADEPQLASIISTRTGQPLAMARVRETLARLFSLGRFEDIRVDAERTELGVALTYDLVPVRAVVGVDFRGDLGQSARRLRQVLTERVGRITAPGRAPAAAAVLEAHYEAIGHFDAAVTPRLDPLPEPDRARLVFEVAAGPRFRIGRVELAGEVPAADRPRLVERLGLSSGRPWDGADVERRVDRYVQSLRDRGYYQASVETTLARRETEPLVDVTVGVAPGPLVTLRFEGDPLPENRLRELVPVAREGSVDEDLLEDSKRRIEDFLRQQGYWRAQVDYERQETPGALTVVFRVTRGQVFVVERVELAGVGAVPQAEVDALVSLRPGEPFVEAALDRDVDVIRAFYQRRGFTGVRVERLVGTDASTPAAAGAAVVPRIVVTEGEQRVVRAVRFEGVARVTEAELRAGLRLVPGVPFNPAWLEADRQSVLIEYLNRGYGDASVDLRVADQSGVRDLDLVYEVQEGEQIRVDQILIVGNRRTSVRTIQRELALAPGDPLALDALVESQRRLRALGLFRRVEVDDVPLPGRTARDVVVDVEEAPATSIGYGAGLEGGRRLRRATDEEVLPAQERLEFAPRGFFEIGRRNLWGKNRSVNLFSRASFRRRDAADAADAGSGFGLNEYRVLGTFREPRVFGTAADAQVSALLEQAIRSSFNFRRRQVNAEISRRLGGDLTLIGRYGYGKTVLFDERYNPEDKPLIDRLFPQLTLSSFSAASVRDTRDDPLDPRRGSLVGLEGEVAARALGSEVGYVKGFWQGFVYRRVPGTARVVLATGVRLGLATGFAREVDVVTGPDGRPTDDVVKDVPASERFYAGGDTTIRGYALDRVGTPETIDQDGFPTGGNGLLILNAELRFPVARSIGGVIFVDAGNVFERATDLELADLRASAGLGVRYRSPIGPIRFDVGWKLDPQVVASGGRERAYALHLSIGQAF